MKKISKMQILAWILSAVPLILVAAAYTRLPDKVPMQWDFGGEIGYEDKWHLWVVAGISPYACRSCRSSTPNGRIIPNSAVPMTCFKWS